jgi:hypothetical protein
VLFSILPQDLLQEKMLSEKIKLLSQKKKLQQPTQKLMQVISPKLLPQKKILQQPKKKPIIMQKKEKLFFEKARLLEKLLWAQE